MKKSCNANKTVHEEEAAEAVVHQLVVVMHETFLVEVSMA